MLALSWRGQECGILYNLQANVEAALQAVKNGRGANGKYRLPSLAFFEVRMKQWMEIK